MISVFSVVAALVLGVGIVLGTVSSWRVGHTPRQMWHSAGWLYIVWLLLLCMAVAS